MYLCFRQEKVTKEACSNTATSKKDVGSYSTCCQHDGTQLSNQGVQQPIDCSCQGSAFCTSSLYRDKFVFESYTERCAYLMGYISEQIIQGHGPHDTAKKKAYANTCIMWLLTNNTYKSLTVHESNSLDQMCE